MGLLTWESLPGVTACHVSSKLPAASLMFHVEAKNITCS
jgi:hypothetical protein